MATCLAVDVGGTKLAAGVVDDTGGVLVSGRVPTPRDGGAEDLFGTLWGLCEEILDRHRHAGGPPVSCCGVGCGGPMTKGGEEVSPLNIPAWRAFPLRARLADRTGVPAFVDNDAKALALAEGWTGAARGERDYVAMVVSTGVGGGVVVDGRLIDGATGNAGHIGHLVVVDGGRRCGCGARGCLEAEASGSAIEAATGRPAAEAGADVRARTGRLVGRAVASVVTLLDIRLAAVGGSVALGFGGEFFEAAGAELTRFACLEYAAGARIVPTGLGADGGIVGGAAVAWRGVGRR